MNNTKEPSIIGRLAEFPLGIAVTDTGIIKSYNEDSGAVEVESEDGQIFCGYEYQLEFIETNPTP